VTPISHWRGSSPCSIYTCSETGDKISPKTCFSTCF